MKNKKGHWEAIYEKKTDLEVSWYQENPETSLNLIKTINPDKQAPVIDVGGGNSGFIAELQNSGYTNLTMLDISGKAIERSKAKTPAPQKIEWITSDILEFQPAHQYFLWHDRATFHFLTRREDIQKYIIIAAESITGQGYLILSGFAATGPEKCSGLEITRYSAGQLEKLFSAHFKLEKSFEEIHKTPFNTEQNFIFTVFRRKD